MTLLSTGAGRGGTTGAHRRAATPRWPRPLAIAAGGLALACLVGTPAAVAECNGEAWGYGGDSKCSNKLQPTWGAAQTRTHDKWTTELYKFTVHASKSTADFRTCDGKHPIKLKSIKGVNTYTFTGPQLSEVQPTTTFNFGNVLQTVGLTPSVGSNEKITGGRYAVTGEPFTCTDCSHLDFDQYNVELSWQTGIVTHYQHTATATYTGYTGSGFSTTSTIDEAV